MVPVIQLKKQTTFSEIPFSERFIKTIGLAAYYLRYNDGKKTPFKVTFALKNASE